MVDNKDYYLIKDNDNYTYTYSCADNLTGRAIQSEVDFDHTIVIPFIDCKQPSAIWVHNNHDYYRDYSGGTFTESGHYENNFDDTYNYNDLVVFLIPTESVFEGG